MNGWRRWSRRVAFGAAAAMLALALAGIFHEAGRADLRTLVDVGGHRLHIQCAGQGRPAVLLETGAMGASALWSWVQPQVVAHARVCSYDRAGLGWSDPGPAPRDGVRMAGELRTLLRNAGETPPYVLVGHSFGGLLVRVYADRYPEDVTGLLLLDPSHPDQQARFEKALGKPSDLEALEARLHTMLPVLARLGVMRFALLFTDTRSRFQGLPPRSAAEFRAFLSDSSHQSAARAEMEAWEETAAQARAARPVGDLPLVVVSAGEGPPASAERPVRLEMHRELAALSSRGSHRTLAGATHASLVTDQAYAAQVAEVIRELVEAADTRTSR